MSLAVFAAIALAIVVPLTRPPAAHACSLAGMSAELLPYYLESSTIVAVGRLTGATQTELVLEVEEGLKGTSDGERLTVNNRQFGLGAGCEVYVEPGGLGWALPEEARVIAFLQPDLSGDADFWMPGHYGYGIYEVGEDDEPFGGWLGPDGGIQPIDDYAQALDEQAATAFEPGLEKIGPCNPIALNPANAAMLSRLSVAAAVATVTGVEGMVATFETERVLRGEPGQSFTVNATQFSLGQRTCDIYPVEGDMPAFREGQRLLVFLYPDEFGVAQYRLANWSHGALGLRGEWVSNGLPALDDVRDLLASGVGTEPPPSNADRIKDGVLYPDFIRQMPGNPLDDVDEQVEPSAAVAPDDGPGARAWWAGGGAIVGAALLAAGVLLWRRPRGSG